MHPPPYFFSNLVLVDVLAACIIPDLVCNMRFDNIWLIQRTRKWPRRWWRVIVPSVVRSHGSGRRPLSRDKIAPVVVSRANAFACQAKGQLGKCKIRNGFSKIGRGKPEQRGRIKAVGQMRRVYRLYGVDERSSVMPSTSELSNALGPTNRSR